MVLVEAHQLGKEEVELEKRLECCFAADLNYLGSRTDDRLSDELRSLLHTSLTMAGKVAALGAKLPEVRPYRPKGD